MSKSHQHTRGHREGHGGHMQISRKDYVTGFIISVVLTAIPFWLVMIGVLPAQTTGLIVVAFAGVQIIVHMVYFLHMNGRSEEGWTMLSAIFTIVIVVITIGGSLWVMHHLNVNMMPSHDMGTM